MNEESKCDCEHCGGHIVFPSEAAGQVKYFCCLLLIAFAIEGCKPKEKEQVIANKVVEPDQALITGQVFIVTKGRENVVLGDEKVALLDAVETRKYFNSKAAEWSNALATAQAKIDQAATNYEVLYRDDLAKFTAAKKYHENIMQTAASDSQQWSDAAEWSIKLHEKIRDLHKLKNSSEQRKQLDEAVEEQALLWDKIKWPSADYFYPSLETTTTDSEGRFKFVVPKSSAASEMLLLAKAQRQTGDETENYWWMVSVSMDGRKTAEFILSNGNSDSIGTSYFLDEKSMQDYLVEYMLKMRAAKADREIEDLEAD